MVGLCGSDERLLFGSMCCHARHEKAGGPVVFDSC